MTPSDLEAMYLEHLPDIDRILAMLVRRHGLQGAAAANFQRWAKGRIVENEYAAVAAFNGASAFTTYLMVVLTMLAWQYTHRRSGRNY